MDEWFRTVGKNTNTFIDLALYMRKLNLNLHEETDILIQYIIYCNSIHIRNPECERIIVMYAIRNDNLKLLKVCHSHNFDLNSYYIDSTPLQLAIRCNNVKIINYLLKVGVKLINYDKYNALLTAIRFTTNNKVCKLLIKHGCYIDEDVLWYALFFNLKEIVNTLIDAGGRIYYDEKFFIDCLLMKIHMNGVYQTKRFFLDTELFYSLLEFDDGLRLLSVDLDNVHVHRMIEDNVFIIYSKHQLLVAHFVKIYLSNIKLNEKIVNALTKVVGNLDNEATKLKSEIVDQEFGLRVYDIFTKDIRTLTKIICRNNIIKKKIQEFDYESKFLIYSSYLNYRIKHAIRKAKLRNKVIQLISLLLNNNHRFNISHICIENILYNYNDFDLQVIFDCYIEHKNML